MIGIYARGVRYESAITAEPFATSLISLVIAILIKGIRIL
jgi:hypothetical protein